MQRKSYGNTPLTNAIAARLLQLWLCSSIIICIGTPGITSALTTTTANTASNSSPVTGNVVNLTTLNTGAPAASNTTTPTTSNTTTSTTSNTSVPTTSNTSLPTTSNTSTPSTINISTPATSNTSTPTTSNNSTSTTSNTTTPTTSNTSTPTTSNTNTLTTSNTSTPTTPNTSTPTTSNTSTPTTNTSTPTTPNTSTPTTPNTSTPTTSNTSTPTTTNTSTPSTSNTSAKRAESTTSEARSERPTAFPIPTENMDVALTLQVKLSTRSFNESLQDSKNDYYKALAQIVEAELAPAFNHSGFQNITVTGFWRGSVGVNFTSYYKDTNVSDLFNILLKRVSSNVGSTELNYAFLQQSLNDSIHNELKDICEQSGRCLRDYYCSVNDGLQPTCQHVCFQHACQNNGYCVAGKQSQPVCKCPEDDDFVYSGDNCEMKIEKMSMSKDKIIGIAAGVGGGVILLLIIAIVVISVRQRRMGRPKDDNILDNASEQSFQSFKGSEDATHQPVSNIGHGAADGNIQSLYRLPEERAENPRFNPYLSLPSAQQQSAVRQRDLSQGYTSAAERPSERSRNVPVKLKQFQERVPNYGEPVQIPRININPHGSEYRTTDNKRSHASVPKTTHTRREHQNDTLQSHSPAGAKVYDYSNDMELMVRLSLFVPCPRPIFRF
ncbi:hypothetical protein BsWGS_18711 [Bradybaena similaris]